MNKIPYKIIKNMDGDKISLLNITTRHQDHQHCKLIIKSSKNDKHRGLYCCNHKKWLQWITYEQELALSELGIQVESQTYSNLTWG